MSGIAYVVAQERYFKRVNRIHLWSSCFAVGAGLCVRGFIMPVAAWETSWTRSPKTWVDYDNSLRSAFETFKIIEDEVPRLREYAQEKSKLKEMPWMEIASEIADGVDRQDARLESASDIMSTGQLRKFVEEWMEECESVHKLITWRLFPEDSAAKTLAEFSRPGAYEQPFFPQTVACNMGS